MGISRYWRLSGIDHRQAETVGAVIQIVEEHANSRGGARALCGRSQVIVGVTDGANILDHRHHAHTLAAFDEQVRVPADRTQPTQKYRQRFLRKGDNYDMFTIIAGHRKFMVGQSAAGKVPIDLGAEGIESLARPYS